MAVPGKPTLCSLGEDDLIRQIRRWLGPACPPAPAGIGDDCAVVPAVSGRTLITVDPVVLGTHFDDSTPPARVAAKLLRRNLSDLAAMGGIPRHAVVALAAPVDTTVAWVEGFYRALGREAVRFGVAVVGGDCTATSETLGVFLTLTGLAPKRPLTRTGAGPGDLIFVTGTLGGSRLGRQFRFEPRLEEGRWLTLRAGVHAAIDISDGLGKDLARLVPINAEAVIDPRKIPISPAARRLATATGRSSIDHAINDGEDFELLFAASPTSSKALERAWRKKFSTRLSCIGQLRRAGSPGSPVVLEPTTSFGVELRGHDHFR